MKQKRKIGILGGAGPAATAKFYTEIINISQSTYKAEQDADFPIVYLYSMPMEGIGETGFTDPSLVKNQLISGLQMVESWGADFIVLPCNTIHHFINEMRAAISIPIISIIDVTVKEVQAMNYRKVGILSTASTRDLELYKSPLEKSEVATVITTDEEQSLVGEVLLAGMCGAQGEKEKQIILKIINRMQNEGAEAVILGCTELPLVISQFDTDMVLLNTIHLLAKHAACEAYK